MKFKCVVLATLWSISLAGYAETYDETWIINHAFDTYHPYQIAKLEAETAQLDAASAKSAYQTKFYAVQSESFSAEPRDIQERISDLQNIAVEGTGQGEIGQTIGFRRDFGIGLQADLSLNVFERQPYQVTAEGTDESGNVTYNPIVKLTLRQSLLSGRGHTALDTDIAQTAADAEIAAATQFSRRAEAA
ncbi:MAG: hypothetical protein HWE20_00235, partial [Gammaproteobacteria bacterium]|nr:hypothetical protein [Gammaproteobacteria bacterium]